MGKKFVVSQFQAEQGFVYQPVIGLPSLLKVSRKFWIFIIDYKRLKNSIERWCRPNWRRKNEGFGEETREGDWYD